LAWLGANVMAATATALKIQLRIIKVLLELPRFRGFSNCFAGGE